MTDEDGTPTVPVNKKVMLRVASPWCTSYSTPGDGGATLVVDRRGVEVSHSEAQTLIETAALHGVTLTEVSE